MQRCLVAVRPAVLWAGERRLPSAATSSAAARRLGMITALPMRAPKPKGKGAKQGSEEPATAEKSALSDDGDVPDGKDLKSSLARHVEHTKRELLKIRGATTNPNMLDNVAVDVYGERQQLKEIAQVALKNPLLLVVSPFDSAMVDAISDAIRDADMGLNPSVDGNAVRVPVPKTSKETREANVKLISKIAEQAKTRIRRSRGDALDKAKKQEGISEDDVRRDTKVVEEQVAAATAEVAKLAEKKKLEVEAA